MCSSLSSSGFPSVRTNVPVLWVLSIFVNIGMWLERYVIVVTSLHRDFLPSSWSMYHGTFWDYATYYGTLGLFLSLMFLFIRFLPVISITEMRELVHETQEQEQERRAEQPSHEGDRAMKVAPRPDRSLRADGRVRPARTTLIEATRRAYERGYRMMEAYTPFPVEGWPRRWGSTTTGSRLVVLIGGMIGGLTGFFMQWFSAVIRLSDRRRRPAAQ